MIFNSIVPTRAWSAGYGGLYVEKKPGASNPYLKNPEFTATDGKVYTNKNPALMSREVSAIASRRGDFRFPMTSLRPINPGNTPGAFERRAPESFAAGEREAMLRESRDGLPYFRYMAPLFVEQPCLACHAEQGYKLGDIRGGISVAFSIEAAGLVAERIRQAVAATEVVLPGGKKLSRTASFGVASFVPGEPRIDDAQSLIKYADHALYRAGCRRTRAEAACDGDGLQSGLRQPHCSVDAPSA